MRNKISICLLSFIVLGTTVGCSNPNQTEIKDSYDNFSPFEFRFKNTYFDSEDEEEILYSDIGLFQMDYRRFVDTTVSYFNPELAKLGLLLSCNLYPWNVYEFSRYGVMSEDTFINKIKAKDITFIQMDHNKYDEDYDDVCSFELAHYEFDYKNKHQQVFFVTYMGTDQEREWASNFDIGADNFQYNQYHEHKDWKNKDNHKGFDVAANRSYEYIDEYLNSQSLNDYEKILFISGHSRGAGIANISGYHYSQNESYKTFCYTFGTPVTTTTHNTLNSSIHNVINVNDIITYLPTKDSGFKRYGYDYLIRGSNYMFEYESFANHEYTSLNEVTVQEEFNKYISCREDIYNNPSQYKDEKAKYFGFENREDANDARDSFIASIGNYYDYGKVTVSDIIYDSNDGFGFKWKTTPSVVFKIAAEYMARKSYKNMPLLLLVAPGLVNALLNNATDFISGVRTIAYPHMPEAYWVILNNH